jgi:6-pyruvoyltetrahydropterin/6-carboxytetrahydropterin synthase
VSITAEIAKEFRFEAAHFLPGVPPHHQCHKLHGHSYVVTVRAKGPINPQSGWVMDLSDLSLHFAPLLNLLDHSLLNDIEGLENPTGENVAVWILNRLEKNCPTLSSVTVEATNRIAVTVSRQPSTSEVLDANHAKS